MRQGRMVASLLELRGVNSEIVTVKTKGDRKREQATGSGGTPGLFTAELEVALSKKRVDCAIHSMKDLPLELRSGLKIIAMLEREDPRDVLVVNAVTGAEDIASLPAGSRVGTSSVRRRSQLLLERRDLEAVDLKGSVPARLRKVDAGMVHAAILSADSLLRLGASRRITQYLDAPGWLPAAGQGIVVIEAREDDEEMNEILSPLDHAATAIAGRAERAFLAQVEGVPEMPIAVLASPDDTGAVVLHAFVSDPAARNPVRGSIVVDPASPEASGKSLAAEMGSRGVASLLLELRNADKFQS